ncbi:dicarboxylate/amino acid:cation symporter [Leptotrichia sp. oral taxon 218]|jgi:sodium:dicarboxylate symporter|uniref:dicarboxylate/amino acid:cation symporter n=1 Tax=Leptotrichia sp. oral taxon 218 TaxID=712361 RepID=UPI001B8AAE4A|nr:dicarboxylate/amino acid:cation symporter [Leptotrichia sp. oral taxon 218]QUB95708.1 dicarboxylate/amino acid:cation symporter [Leptotrichia sp. oral taxon 218]
MRKFRIGLVSRLLIAIVLGIFAGFVLPEPIIKIAVTFSELFSKYLAFIIPLMIIGFVVAGISDLTQGAGKLLGITTLISYSSTIIAGTIAYIMASTVFPHIIDGSILAKIGNPEKGMLKPFFEIDLPPMLDVTSAVVFSFIMGLAISWLKSQKNDDGETIYKLFSDFSIIIVKVLLTSIIPVLPFYIFGTFANMAHSGGVFTIMSVFIKVFLCVLALHIAYLVALFAVSGAIGKKNPFQLLKNQIPGYITALGTQSSAATIPVNVECAKNNGVSEEIRDFVIPLCATIHMAGSIITITSCVTAVLMINNMAHSLSIMLPFIMTLGVAMVAAPGAPGGAIMSALPFLGMVGIVSTGPLGTMLIALYITQDSFGTAANISGDNAIAVIVDTIYHKYIKK